MPHKTEYDPTTGQLGAVVFADLEDVAVLQVRPGFNYVDGSHDSLTEYFSGGSILPRPAQSTTLTGMDLANLPTGATLHIDGTAYPVTGTTVTLDFPLPGTYKLRVECFPYLDWTGEVTA